MITGTNYWIIGRIADFLSHYQHIINILVKFIEIKIAHSHISCFNLLSSSLEHDDLF